MKRFIKYSTVMAALLAVNSTFAKPLVVHDWMSTTGPLYPHSAIIEGESQVAIVDVQQSKSEAHRLVADVLEIGKSVKWVYVTHPHLDHFAGANIVKSAFPEVIFYGPSAQMNQEMARQVATRRIPLGQGTLGGAFNLPESAPDYFVAAPEQGLKLDEEVIEVLIGRGDHQDSSVVWVPSASTVIAGDVIFNKTHAFFGDHDNIDAWINLVERIEDLEPRTALVGYSKTANPSGEIVTDQLLWLKDLKRAMSQYDNWQKVREKMVILYPDYRNDFIFEFSYGVKAARK